MTLANLPATTFTGAELGARVNAALTELRAGRRFASVAALLADQTLSYGQGSRMVQAGDLVETEGFRYQVAAATATDHHVTTAGGVRLYVAAGERPEAFGALANGAADDTAAFNAARIALARHRILAPGSYRLNAFRLTTSGLDGQGSGVLTAAAGAERVLALGLDATHHWRHRAVRGVTIDGNTRLSDGIDFSNGGTNDEASGRWTVEASFLRNCRHGIRKRFGNIGNIFRSVSVRNCDFGYHAVGQTTPVMHGGCDLWHGGEIAGCSTAAIYINSPQVGTGGTEFDGLVVEDNPGMGVFVAAWASSYTPLVFRNFWGEKNATGGNVTIDGLSYAPRDFYLKDAAAVLIETSAIRKLTVDNSRVVLDACFFDDQTQIEVINGGVLQITRANVDGLRAAVVVDSLIRSARAAGSFAAAHRAPPRTHQTRSLPGSGVVRASRSFGGTTAIPADSPSTEPLQSTQVIDGAFDPQAAQFSQSANQQVFLNLGGVTDGRWYVYTWDWKQVSGAPSSITLVGGTTLSSGFAALSAPLGQWTTMGGVARAGATGSIAMRINSNSGAHVFRLRDAQLVQFDTEAEALSFYNSRALAMA
ncbi:hypothetical protein [Rubellimicrobium roseum]|uniref:Pectate lyase superfamily protein domain-containing protein n=1 Tax=Rubellimicrobium roseum TaxID=687525 RepID=A0A5C4N6W3_9RHOB|nr:hypothetical protein [Rubellimicrobium roseum]TNC66855.1 hypothetical protein FHG71_16125 [Rubellimicrobium roseum]